MKLKERPLVLQKWVNKQSVCAKSPVKPISERLFHIKFVLLRLPAAHPLYISSFHISHFTLELRSQSVVCIVGHNAMPAIINVIPTIVVLFAF